MSYRAFRVSDLCGLVTSWFQACIINYTWHGKHFHQIRTFYDIRFFI